MRKRVFAFVAILGAAWSAGEAALGSDFDVVINEVHYNPLSNLEDDEFIELFNRGPTSVDLSGWRFVEGISFVFAPGTRIDAKEFLVVSPDAARALTRYGLTHAAGNYSGHLDNDGEIVTLVNSQGAIMSRVHYGDGDLWPSRPDGLGASLELLDPHAVPDLPRKWSSSLYLDGTPGEANSRAALGSAAPKIVVGAQELWRYWKSSTEPSNPLLDWTTTGFNDSAWATGPGGFGYGTQPFETELADMQGSYTGLYIRSKFTLTAAELSAIQSGRKSLVLTVRYDDGFVAYANGSEIGRANAANAGSPPLHGATADGSLTGQAFVTLEPATAGLVAGQNAVAIHGLNSGTASADFLLEAELRLNEAPVSARDIAPDVVINEVKPTEGASAGFIELYNRSAETLGLAGYQIIDSQGSAFSIPGGTNLPPHSWVAFSAAELDFEPVLANASYALVIQDSPSGRRELVDGLHPRAPP
ncbi:MAG TPA: lamin tail domain-containing protein, partial [Planctomycetota bacterium]|nr:lamin tail domain-containing protein [Planctomycetota bacterium]